MAINVGPEDRVVRIVAGLGLGVLIYFGHLEGVTAIVVGLIAAYLLITGVLRMCLLYKMIGVDTSIHETPYNDTDDRAGL
jgi:hypothetical protein